MSKESLHYRVSGIVGDFLLDNIHPEITGEENILETRTHLNKGGTLVIESNHWAKLDPILFGKIMNEQIASFDRIRGFASRRHFDPSLGLLSKAQSVLGPDWEERYGLKINLVVQEKDRKLYLDHARFNRKVFLQEGRALRESAGLVEFIVPQGTRTTTNRLLRVQGGVAELLKIGSLKDKDKVKCLPLAGEHKMVLPGRHINVTAGKLFTYEDLLEDQRNYLKYLVPVWETMGITDPDHMPDITESDCAAVRIAELLQPKEQGVYAPLVNLRKTLLSSPSNYPIVTPAP